MTNKDNDDLMGLTLRRGSAAIELIDGDKEQGIHDDLMEADSH